MSKRSPRPRTTRRGKRPVADENAAPTPASPEDALPSIILADDLLTVPEAVPADDAAVPAASAPNGIEDTRATFDPHEDTRATLDPHEDTRATLDPHEDTRATLDTHEDTRATLDPHEDTRATLDPHEDTRATFDTSGPDGEERGAGRQSAAPPHRSPLARSPLPPASPPTVISPEPAPRVQRYAAAYDDSAPVELPKYVEEAPRPAWRPPTPVRPLLDPLDDLEVDFRPNRRKYNWLVVLACVIIGILGVVLGSRPDKTPHAPATADTTAPAPDAADAPDATESTDNTRVDVAGDSASSDLFEKGDAGAESADTLIQLKRPDVSPPNPTAARALDEAKRALDEGRWESALPELDRALAEAPGNPRALFARARALDKLGKTDEALKDLDAVLAVDAHHPYALLLAGEALEKQGKVSEARVFYDRYLAAWPKTRKAEALRKRFEAPAPK